jgi:hypothetical protein
MFVLERHEGPWTATVFCRSRPLLANAARVAVLRLYRELFLNTDVVLPQVPKIILIEESLAEPKAKVGEANLGWIMGKPHTTRLRDAVVSPPDDELGEMVAFPAHHNLEDIVQVGNGAVAADQEAPPNRWTDLP